MSTSATQFDSDLTVAYWAEQVRLGIDIVNVPEQFRARVEQRLGKVADQTSVTSAPPVAETVRQSEPWWRGSWGVLVAMLLPFVAMGVLIWWLSRIPQSSGGAGFVEGFGKLKAS